MSLVRFIQQRLRLAACCEQGLAYIEFALSIGVLLIMFFGAIEVTRYILIVQKVEKTVDTLTDVLTQALPGSLDDSAVSNYLNATQKLMNPYTFGGKGAVILSDVTTPDTANTPATINWQVCGGGTMHATSNLGPAGGTADLTGFGITLNASEEILVGEIFYNYTPMLNQNIIAPVQMFRFAIFKPRYGYKSLNTGVTSVACP